jgi:hypothetical protein
MTPKFGLKQVGTYHVLAVMEFGQNLPDGVRLAYAAWTDDADTSITEGHFCLVA